MPSNIAPERTRGICSPATVELTLTLTQASAVAAIDSGGLLAFAFAGAGGHRS
jgi:hypothetical protein